MTFPLGLASREPEPSGTPCVSPCSVSPSSGLLVSEPTGCGTLRPLVCPLWGCFRSPHAASFSILARMGARCVPEGRAFPDLVHEGVQGARAVVGRSGPLQTCVPASRVSPVPGRGTGVARSSHVQPGPATGAGARSTRRVAEKPPGCSGAGPPAGAGNTCAAWERACAPGTLLTLCV